MSVEIDLSEPGAIEKLEGWIIDATTAATVGSIAARRSLALLQDAKRLCDLIENNSDCENPGVTGVELADPGAIYSAAMDLRAKLKQEGF